MAMVCSRIRCDNSHKELSNHLNNENYRAEDGGVAPSPAPMPDAVSRRNFLVGMTAAGIGLSVLGSQFALPKAARASGRPVLHIVNVPDNGSFPGIPGGSSTHKVLNYALALEILEADIYRQALNLASGKSADTPLPADVSGYSLSVPTGTLIPVSVQLGFSYLQEFAAVEAAHRDFLRGVITSMKFKPIDPNPGGYKVDFGAGDLRSILTVLRNVEETGVRGYLGAAQFITSTELIQTAASIYSTEARHSAVLNLILGYPVGPSREADDSVAVLTEHGDNNYEHWQTPTQILDTVKPFYA